MKSKTVTTQKLIRKLENSLRGSALSLTMLADTKPPQESLEEMEVIEDLLKYIRNYESNKKILENLNKDKEIKEMER